MSASVRKKAFKKLKTFFFQSRTGNHGEGNVRVFTGKKSEIVKLTCTGVQELSKGRAYHSGANINEIFAKA